MDNDTMSNLTEIGKNLTSAVDKFASMMKNRSDYKFEEKKKRLELEDLKARIDVVKNSDIPMEFNKDGITIYSPEAIELMSRAGHRLANQELKKQVNIENTLYETKNILEKEKENGQDVASSEPVKDDFMTQFYNGVGEISDVDMQLLWAKLLAGEIKQPRTFSLRTIQKLKVISSKEAILFEKISPYVIDNDYIPNDANFLQKYNVNYSDLMILQDCGILSLVKTSKYYNSEQAAIYNKKISVFKKMVLSNDEKNIIETKVFPLSQFGKELMGLVTIQYNDNYFYEFLNRLKSYQKNSATISVSCYEITNRNNGNIEYISSKDLLKEYNEKCSSKRFTMIINKCKKQ